jgi:Cu2+-exporting ATPase
VHLVGDDLQTESNEPLDALVGGKRFRVLPGEVVPVMAELESNKAAVSLEWINGESAMRSFSAGQYVPSGAQNIGIEPVLLRARQSWKDALLAKLLDAHPEEQRNTYLEKVLKIYLLAVLATAAAGGMVWSLILGQPLTAAQVALSVLIVSCPCALGVAIPLAQEWAILHLRKFGVFTRSHELFPRLAGIRRITFDKTGTLTMEAPVLANREVLSSMDPVSLSVLRQMVQSSLHPVSRALREALLADIIDSVSMPDNLRIEEEIGMGLLAVSSSGEQWSLGRPGWQSPDTQLDTGCQCEFREKGKLLAGFRFEEALREDARESIDQMKQDYTIAILSGDTVDKVKTMATRLGLGEASAIGGMSPQEKAAAVEASGRNDTLYIGDGANDSLAFSKAAVRGTPATPHGLLQDKADFYFTGRGLSGLLELLATRKLRQTAVRSTFAFAVIYNLIVVTVALLGYMHPLLAAILMPLSSLCTISIVAIIYRRRENRLQA